MSRGRLVPVWDGFLLSILQQVKSETPDGFLESEMAGCGLCQIGDLEHGDSHFFEEMDLQEERRQLLIIWWLLIDSFARLWISEWSCGPILVACLSDKIFVRFR